MNILVNLPDYKHIHGGVTNHYIGLRPHWKHNVVYNRVGKRREGWPGVLWLPWDYMKFLCRCLFRRPDGVVLNPSLNLKAWSRDRVFLRLARLTGVKVLVMFHGWSDHYFDSLDKKRFAAELNRASAVLVLATNFRRKLIEIGVKAPVELTTTKFADEYLDGFDIASRKGRMKHFLFLCRVLKTKGIFETLDLFKKIKADYPDATLTVAGDGADLDNARRYAKENKIEGICFTGHVEGTDLIKLFSESDFYLFPTYGEGMPTSLLEAMAFGLPALVRPVGGIPDFFVDDRMGILTESLSPDEYYRMLLPWFDRPGKVVAASLLNHSYAVEHFKASAVTAKMEQVFERYFGDSNPR